MKLESFTLWFRAFGWNPLGVNVVGLAIGALCRFQGGQVQQISVDMALN